MKNQLLSSWAVRCFRQEVGSYERVITLDRVNGFEIRQVASNTTDIFSTNRMGLFTLTVTGAGGAGAVTRPRLQQ